MNNERLIRTRRGLPCPICGQGNQECGFNSRIALCVNVPSDREYQGRSFKRTWLHKLKEGQTANYVYPERKEGCPIANREQRDKVYRAFLGLLKLEPRHWGMLIRSKIPGSIIINRLYKTIPDYKDRWRYTKKLLEMGFSLEGIPGFFLAETKERKFWTFMAKEGMFIPVMDKDGLIIALRIRLDKPERNAEGKEKNKYRWFSSDGLLMGTGSSTHCHVAMGDTEEIWITEGEKKSEVVRHFTGNTCISVPGVGEWHKAIPIIKDLSPKRVVVAYDADKKINPDVRFYESRLIEALKELPGVIVLVAEWDLAHGKGIDDYMLMMSGHVPDKIAA